MDFVTCGIYLTVFRRGFSNKNLVWPFSNMEWHLTVEVLGFQLSDTFFILYNYPKFNVCKYLSPVGCEKALFVL